MEKTDLSPIKQIAILEVAERLGIEVKGKKAICFGGHDTDPSLCFVPAKNIWKCFGCDKRGDSITLVMDVLRCDFKEALNWFEREFGVAVLRDQDSRRPGHRALVRNRFSRPPVVQTMLTAADENFRADPQVYAWLIEKCGEVADAKGIEYLRRHGIPLQVANRFIVRELRSPSSAFTRLVREWGAARVLHSGLAWGDENPDKLIWGSYTLLFPFLQDGTVIYVQGRPLTGKAKFLGLRGVPKPLYNAERLASLPVGTSVHLCEGVPDALALEARGLPALAVLGASSFRPEWVDRLLRYDVVVVPDGDSGGKTFLRTVSEAFRDRGKAIRTVRMPEGRDAADVLGEFGGGRMSDFLEEISDQLNLRWAWEKVRREARPGDIWFDEVELAGFELELEQNLGAIATEFRTGRYRLASLRPLPFPKHADKDGNPRIRQAFQVGVRDQVAWTAVVNVVGPHVDSKMPAWSYGNRLYRSIWVKEDEDGTKRRMIGNYRHASGRLFLPFAQSWPVFRRHVYLSTRAMTTASDLPDMDERTEEELELQQRLRKEHRCPFVYREYWNPRRPEGVEVELYWCSIDLEKFYPTFRLAVVRDNIVAELPSEWQEDAGRLVQSMLRFPLDTSDWGADELKKMDLRPTGKTFRHIPTGLYVAGFLANVGLLNVDADVAECLRERNVAHFRFVDDHIILAYSFDELVRWVEEYARLLDNRATGARVNLEKVEPKALGELFSGKKSRRRASSLEGLEKAAIEKCRLDPKFPSPLMTKTIALVSGIARTDFNLLETAELASLTEQLEQLLLVDLPEEEMPEKTRLSFAASRLSRIAECRISNNDVTVHLNSRRDALEAELGRKDLKEERRREIEDELAAVAKSLKEETETLRREVNRAFQLFRKVLRERPDRVRLWTRAILMCRSTGVKGLGDILGDIDRESRERPLAGEYLLANTLALLGGQTLVAARILRDRNVARWQREAAEAFLEDVRDTPVPSPDMHRARRFLQLSRAQYCFGLHCASLVLGEQPAGITESSPISFEKELIRAGQKCTRKGVAERAPEEWVWWAARKTLRDLSARPAAFVKDLGTHLSSDKTTFAFWRFFPFDAPLPVLTAMAVESRKATAGWWVDALRNRPEVAKELRSNTRRSEVSRACRMVTARREETVTLYDWCRFLGELQGDRATDPRGGEWTALEIARQIAELIQQEPVFGPSYVRRARRGFHELPHVHPANFRVPRDWVEGDEPTWESWQGARVRQRDGACRVLYVHARDRIADARYTPLNAATSALFQSVNPVRGLGLVLYGLLRRDFALPAIWNGPGHSDVLGMLPPLLMGAMTCSSWTMGVLQGCLLPRVTENQFLRSRPLAGYLDDDALQDPPMFFSAAEVSAALRKCQSVLKQYQLSTLNHRARQLIPVNVHQLTDPEWSKIFSKDVESGGQS